jgi:uncharacterized membrane protein YfcA
MRKFTALASSSIGAVVGLCSSTTGLGGGLIGVPLLRKGGYFSQHQAQAMGLLFVVGASAAASLATFVDDRRESQKFKNSESDIDESESDASYTARLDVKGAACIAAAGVVTAPIAAKYSTHFTPMASRRIATFMMLGVALPMVGIKRMLADRQLRIDDGEISHIDEPNVSSHDGELMTKERRARWVAYAALGVAAGSMSGLFGLGGGVVITPALSWISDQGTAVATSLLALLPPSVVALISHWRLGNLPAKGSRVFLPMMAGAGLGAFCGSHAMKRMSDNEQRVLFCVLITLISFLHIANLRK